MSGPTDWLLCYIKTTFTLPLLCLGHDDNDVMVAGNVEGRHSDDRPQCHATGQLHIPASQLAYTRRVPVERELINVYDVFEI